MSEPTTFIVDPTESDREHLAAQLGPDLQWVGCSSLEEVARAVDEGRRPAIVVLGPGIGHHEAIMLSRSVHDERLSVAVVRVTNVLDPAELRDALRAGVADVVERDADGAEVAAAVKRAHEELATMKAAAATDQSAPPVGDSAAMIAVASGKGGVGSSLVATNLALSLASRDLRATLVDLDVRGGDLAIMMQQRPSLSILDALDRIDHLDVNAIDGYLTTAVGGVRILAAPVDGQDVYVDPDDFDQLLGFIGGLSDVIVVDVGNTWRPIAQHVMGAADRVVVVTTLEVPAIRGTRRLLGEFAHLGLPTHKILMVANKADASTGLAAGDAEKTLDTTFVTGIADDKHGPRSVNEGDPLVNRRRSKAAKGITELAGTLYKQLSLGTERKT